MMIAVDSRFLSKHLRHTGTGVYLYNVLSQCLRIAASEPAGIEFHGFTAPREDWANNGLASPLLHVHKTRALSSKRYWIFGGMAMQAAGLRPDLVFLPSALSSIPGPFCPLLSTILDVIPYRLPRRLTEAGRLANWMTRINARLARKVITISECSRRDLVEVLGLDPVKVAVTYLGYDESLFNPAPADTGISTALLNRLGIRRPYILHHGMVQLRKNLHRLIQAWDRVRERHRDLDAPLVLAGPLGHGHEQILRAREASPHRDDIIVTGLLADAELAVLIKNAFLCVIPSLYEGFCLPLVEAMACGVPTLGSNNSCIPEISGGILEYFAPSSLEEMAVTVCRALQDSELRNRLRRGGLARVAQFSWERCARETLRIFAQEYAET